MADLLNVTNATMYATGGSRESEIQMNMLRCGSNLAANYGLAIKEKAKVWEKEYFGESLSIPPEAQQFFDHHRNAPPPPRAPSARYLEIPNKRDSSNL